MVNLKRDILKSDVPRGTHRVVLANLVILFVKIGIVTLYLNFYLELWLFLFIIQSKHEFYVQKHAHPPLLPLFQPQPQS